MNSKSVIAIVGSVVISVTISLVVIILTDQGTPLGVKIMQTQILIDNLQRSMDEYAEREPNNLYPGASSEENGYGTSILIEELMEGNYYQFEDSQLSDDNPPQLVDSWGNPMRYQPWKGKTPSISAHNVNSYDLWSAGPDGIFGTVDDITNWSNNSSSTSPNSGVQTRAK